MPWHPQLSIRRQCELLGLGRANWYYQPAEESADTLKLMRHIDQQYTRTPFDGSRRMAVYLNGLGYAVNRKRVQRHMRVMGLAGVALARTRANRIRLTRSIPICCGTWWSTVRIKCGPPM